MLAMILSACFGDVTWPACQARPPRAASVPRRAEKPLWESDGVRTAASRVDVRRAGPEDAGTVLGMLRELAAHTGASEHVTGTVPRWAAILARPDVVVLLAERDGEPVGYVSSMRRPHFWTARDILALDDLFVREGYRDAGVGRLLMSELARIAAPEALPIRWEVDEDNERAQQFYRRLGASLRSKVIALWPADRFPDPAG
jgi:ribosomal protein S18 acetylase RimI-like enzyme